MRSHCTIPVSGSRHWLDVHDFVVALRLLRRRLAFSLLFLLCLSVGVGTITALVTAVDRLYLRPLPYPNAERLVVVWNQSRRIARRERVPITPAQLLEWRAAGVFQTLAGVDACSTNPDACVDLVGLPARTRLRGAFATPEVFDVFGVRAAIGRTFTSEAGDADCALLGHGAWLDLFGQRQDIVGSSITVRHGRERQARRVTICGVAPSTLVLSGPETIDVWLPRSWTEVAAEPPLAAQYRVFARLRPDMPADVARATIRTGSSGSVDALGPYTDLEPLQAYIRGTGRQTMLVFSLLAGVTLAMTLVSCASLQLMRSIERTREFAIRVACAGGYRAVRHAITIEASLLGIAGAAAGGCVAYVATGVLRTSPLVAEAPFQMLRFNAASAAMAVAIGATVGALQALAAVLVFGRQDVAAILGASAPTASLSKSAIRLHRLVMIGQCALVVALIAVAMSLRSSARSREQAALGFEPRGLSAVRLRLMGSRYADRTEAMGFQRQLLDRLSAGGIRDISLSSALPFVDRDSTWKLNRYGALESRGPLASISVRQVDWRYFSLLGVATRQGRVFTPGDDLLAPRVAVLSRSLAAGFFGTEDPLGKTMTLSLAGGHTTIVGVVDDVKQSRLDESVSPALYVPSAQMPPFEFSIVFRAAQRERALHAIDDAIADLDNRQAASASVDVEERVSRLTARDRFAARLATALAIVAAIMATAGLYGTAMLTLRGRRREIAVRQALGASTGRAAFIVARELYATAGLGLIAGFGFALVLIRAMRAAIPDLADTNVVLHVSVAGALLLLALAACSAPLLRAASASPADALRAQ